MPNNDEDERTHSLEARVVALERFTVALAQEIAPSVEARTALTRRLKAKLLPDYEVTEEEHALEDLIAKVYWL